MKTKNSIIELSPAAVSSLEQGSNSLLSVVESKSSIVLHFLNSVFGSFKETTNLSIPAPLLVGIELNPGPNKTAFLQILNPKKPRQKSAKKVKAVQIYNQNRPTPMGIRNQVVQGRFSPNRQSQMSEAKGYLCNLRNPFDCVPVRLGGNCMMPTGISTLTNRSIVTVPAGSFSMVLYPWAINGNFVSSSVVGALGPYTYSIGGFGMPASFPQGAATAIVANGGRVVSAGVRIVTLNSATNDQGVITVGCLPREGYVTGINTGQASTGFPVLAGATSTQGFNEFFNYLQTESYPIKLGASVFYRPEDPQDFEFKLAPTIIGVTSGSFSANSFLTPFFVVGITGVAPLATTTILVEQILHVEYTVASVVAGVIGTSMGKMAQQTIVDVGKAAFAGLVDTTQAGVVGGLMAVGEGLAQGAARLMGYNGANARGTQLALTSGSQFSSSDLTY